MAVGQHEAVAVGPVGVGRVVLASPGCRARGRAGRAPSPCPGGRSWRAAGRPWRTRGSSEIAWASMSGASREGIGATLPNRPSGDAWVSTWHAGPMDDRAVTAGWRWSPAGAGGSGRRRRSRSPTAGWDVAISYRERADAADDGRRRVRRRRPPRRSPCGPTSPSPTAIDAAVRAPSTTALGPARPARQQRRRRVAGRTGRRRTPPSAWTPCCGINVVGAFLAAGEAVRRMSTSTGGAGGVIVNVSSRAAVLGSAGEYVDYAASKAAVDALTVGLAARGRRGGHPGRRRAARADRHRDPRPGPARAARLDAAARAPGHAPRRSPRRSSGWRRRRRPTSPAPRSTSAAAAESDPTPGSPGRRAAA